MKRPNRNHILERRKFLKRIGGLGISGMCMTGTPFLPEARGAGPGEVLYNGIRLLSSWPPRLPSLSLEPMTVPYLTSPPEVIVIDGGRQLFVDDFLIERTTLRRTFHTARYHPENPILKPDKGWEQTGRDAAAMVFSDGVWHDPQDGLYKMWYMGGIVKSTCYAFSKDGIHWQKPTLNVQPGTNIVQPGGRDSSTVWLDLEERDPKRRFKMFRSHGDGGWALSIHFSPDGINWSDPVCRSGPCGDRTTVFYNPFRKVWVFSIRADAAKLGRIRKYVETRDIVAGAHWKADEPALWIGADRLDPMRKDLNIRPQLYNLDAVAYESLLLGLFTIWRGQPRDRAKPNEVCVGFSRDGFHWHRPDRRAFIPVSENFGDWNWGNVQSAGACCLIVGEQLYFYVSGRAGIRGSPASGVCGTGLATLRRDGFASMDAEASGGTLTTRVLRFRGQRLFVNVAARDGELRAEILDREGRIVEPFSRANCLPIKVDRTLQMVEWQGNNELSSLGGKPVRFRFSLTNGRLYAFWVSPNISGASHGFVAAGGPGFKGPKDIVGSVGERE
jgi:hypothetical protein